MFEPDVITTTSSGYRASFCLSFDSGEETIKFEGYGYTPDDAVNHLKAQILATAITLNEVADEIGS